MDAKNMKTALTIAGSDSSGGAGQTDFGKAQVCAGGITLDQLTDSLESVQHPGIFFAGEALDVDGVCGGYNLQWAWSSGSAAGRAAAGEHA